MTIGRNSAFGKTKGTLAEIRQQQFESQEEFHKGMAKLPFRKKLEILVRLQAPAKEVKSTSESGLLAYLELDDAE